MSFTVEHKADPKPIAELPDQQVALVTIKTRQGTGQMMAIKIEGQLLAYHGGAPIEYEALGWVPMNESA